MLKSIIFNFFTGAIASALFSYIFVGLVIGGAAMPTTFQAHVISNVISAAIGGGLSGIATTIVMSKKKRKKDIDA